MAGAQLFFKPENLQKTGSFKIRGATNAVFSLTEEEAKRGVVAPSAGNHAGPPALLRKICAEGKKVGIILSGENLDLRKLPFA